MDGPIVPVQVIYLVGVLALLSVLLIGFILQHLHPFSSTRLILTGLSHRVQLPHLVLWRGRQRSELQLHRLNHPHCSHVALTDSCNHFSGHKCEGNEFRNKGDCINSVPHIHIPDHSRLRAPGQGQVSVSTAGRSLSI